jgi:carbamoyltransferase
MKRMWAFQQCGLLDGIRRKGEPFTQKHKDIAAGLQTTLETIALHVLTHFREATGRRKLGLAGGVAHNCTMNGKIIGSGLFDEVFVQPAAHDAGLAIGAAIAAAKAEGIRFSRAQMPHLYLGTDIRSDDVENRLRRWGALVDVRRSAAVEQETAKLIADGKVVGWVQGRSEFGPRALGNRSILADPRPRENKTIINSMVKKRETYRPFAPSVLVERMRDYFHVPERVAALPFMIVVVDVLEDKRELLGAITHVDGTARVQTVSRGANERYWELISEFGELTGVPVLLNTSFNNNAEPIVDSVDDAVVCFLTTRIDCLVVDDCIVTRKQAGLTPETLKGFFASVPASYKLVKQKWESDGGASALRDRFGIQSHASAYFGEVFGEISRTMFVVLSHDQAPLGAVWDQLALGQSERARSVEEVLDLWQRRLITLQPIGPGALSTRSGASPSPT